jgi:tetratricopeptide (TPR) repeat protein
MLIAADGNSEPWKRFSPYLQRRRPPSKQGKVRMQTIGRRSHFWKLGVIAVSLGIGLYLQVGMAVANHGYLRARLAFPQDASTGISMYLDAFKYFSPYAPEEKLNCAYQIVTSVVEKRKVSQSFDAGPLLWRLTGEALAAHPLDARYYITLNDMYNKMALYLNPDYAAEAERFGRKALELSPKRQEAMLHLGRTYVIRNQAGKAVEINRRMIQEADFTLGHWLLGLSLLQNHQGEEAGKEIRRALEGGYKLNETDIATLKDLMGEKEFEELTAGK